MATTTSNPAAITTWKLDPAHSHAEFKVKHMMISNVKGSFNGLSGTLTEHATDTTLSTVEASIDVTTISTGDAQRDAHLKSADFFDAEKFPTMTFKSTSGQAQRRRRLQRHRRPDPARPDPPADLRRRRPQRARQRSLGQHPHRPLRHHQNQPQRLRPELERSSRNRRHPRRRRREDHHRSPVHQGVMSVDSSQCQVQRHQRHGPSCRFRFPNSRSDPLRHLKPLMLRDTLLTVTVHLH